MADICTVPTQVEPSDGVAGGHWATYLGTRSATKMQIY